MDHSQYAELFLTEAREHIAAMNHLLLALEADHDSARSVDGLFRSVHTIKGMAGAMGYGEVADLSHEMEHLLEALRGSGDAPPAETVNLLFEATDALERAVERTQAPSPTEPAEASELLQRLLAAAAEIGAAGTPRAPAGEADRAGSDRLTVELRVEEGAPLPGVRAYMALGRARELGEVEGVTPPEAQLTEEGYAGRLRFLLRTAASPEEVREALLSVPDIARVSVGTAGAPSPAAGPAAPARRPERALSSHIRIDLRRLDHIMDQVGELVIARDRLRGLAALRDEPEAREAVAHLARLIGTLQDDVLEVRMVPVWQVFERFPRMVRDAARALGKEIDFRVEGRELELDRSMLDGIGEPLMHLLRNSVDHGIEPPEERVRAGKSATGTLRLAAVRARSGMLIRVSDDGRGIQRDKVARRAVDSGFLTPEAAAALTPDEVHALILQPGFSTADRLTDVSGRGVGLDVVSNRIRALGGTLDIASEPGEGTTFTLRLPLTLAIVQALLVRAREETYALPLVHVSETVELEADELRGAAGRRMAMLRDEPLPVLALGEVLQLEGQGGGRAGTHHVVVLELGESLVGLEVDEVIGRQEVVVKTFDATSDTLRIFSGATILPDGRPSLILDVGSLTVRESRVRA
jgi:two-component system, chemotaxis family, sensor kinase CheA